MWHLPFNYSRAELVEVRPVLQVKLLVSAVAKLPVVFGLRESRTKKDGDALLAALRPNLPLWRSLVFFSHCEVTAYWDLLATFERPVPLTPTASQVVAYVPRHSVNQRN